MLAPANHGSALAQLGKGRLSRIKHLLQGVEPGERVLDWLELGSDPQWELNEARLDYDCVSGGVFPFVLTGQKIDRALYDALNSYTDEIGSDGVVRVAAANLNYSFLHLVQDQKNGLTVKKTYRSKPTAFGVLPALAHSGDDLGIIRSVSENGERPRRIANRLGVPLEHPTARWVLRCLQVTNRAEYAAARDELAALTAQTQEDERIDRQQTLFGTREYRNSRCIQVVFRLIDDRGQTLPDYDLYLTAGPEYSEQDLPPGFFVDRQRNRRNPGKLTYYLDHDTMFAGLQQPGLNGHLGFCILARPTSGLAFYRELDFRSTLTELRRVLVPNETMMVEIELKRVVDANVFRMSNDLRPTKIEGKPSGKTVA
ncbi:MAG: phospholipase [Verrucomicrobia bacterium]|nr:phospholipase [Verrucomicrobiota bacterium]